MYSGVADGRLVDALRHRHGHCHLLWCRFALGRRKFRQGLTTEGRWLKEVIRVIRENPASRGTETHTGTFKSK